ncbi:hypothetical protein MVEN_00263300 [Mycena venus]|uniref:Uncharacterized protein n=1 Tax=Mycena venus TaxID=2733690 RepID=A0A8H6Z1Z3_9AGAR|nr:hypothetical protein MVEN_00263300 [Mycena venus]
MSSTRIAFSFIPGDQPLSNGLSGIPDLDDTVFAGSMLYDLQAADASLDAFAAFTVPRVAPLGMGNLDLESVEDIFADLHAALSVRAPPHPLVLPEREFRPFDPAEVADTPPPSPTWRVPGIAEMEGAFVALSDLTNEDGLLDDTEEARETLERAAITSEAVLLARAAHEDTWADFADSDSDSDFDPGNVQDSDFKQRPTCSLPARVLPKSSPSSKTRRATKKGRRTAASAAPPSASLVTTTTGKKRKAKQAKAPAAAKRKAVSPPSSTTTSSTNTHTSTSEHLASMPVIPGYTDDNLPPPADAHLIEPKYYFLLRLGCTFNDKGQIECFRCQKASNLVSDIGRHVGIHFRSDTEKFCSGCPQSFSRDDSCKRHEARQAKRGHLSAERKAFLAKFEELQIVVAKRAECDYASIESVMAMNKALAAMFEELFAASQA